MVQVYPKIKSAKSARSLGASASEAVIEALRRQIASGALRPGEALRQDELATRFGISRIPVREALRALQAEGLVEYSTNRGAVVASASLDDVLELLEVRIALECHALRMAVPKFADADAEHARRILQDYDRAPDPAQWAEMNWRFHAALYAPCDCERLLDGIEANYGHFSRHIRQLVSTATGKERPQREHHELLKLCEAGKADAAAALLSKHIRHTQRMLAASARFAGQRR